MKTNYHVIEDLTQYFLSLNCRLCTHNTQIQS